MNANPIALAAAWLLVACIAPSGRGEPLYPVTEPRPKREDVAELGGYVRQVDNQQVSESGSFELLPGCHIIKTPAHWGSVDSSSGGILVDTGHRTFAIVMKPGYRYHIGVSVKTMGGSTGSAAVEGTEEDLKGKKTQVLYPATSTADIEACKEAGAHVPPP